MAKSTRQYVFEGLELLPEALIPFVEKRLENALQGRWQIQVLDRMRGVKANTDGGVNWDQAALFNAMNIYWDDGFRTVLGRSERAIINELVEVRNKFSHNEKFSYDDAERALDSMRRLMESISAGETAEKIGKMRDAILRIKFRELSRNEERKKTHKFDLSVDLKAGLRPWREVVEPHNDVATGDFQQAEFAADLGKVHKGSAPSEYSDPTEFFSRTYLTDGLSTLLVSAAKRLSGSGGDPVIELQTNFGGGKTHSMLALYHMASDLSAQTPPKQAGDLPGLDQLLDKHDLSIPDKVNRAVLVGTARGPSDVLKTPDGRKIRTTWGEMAWQLGGAKAFDLIADNDANGIAPGSNLLEQIFNDCSPCLILIDEWVAYLRQIYRISGLPAGSFDANLSFVQSLTEAVKASPRTILVASLPASQIEVGGEGGQEALVRLKQTFSRVESSWRPASQEESYEIVRSRLFKEIPSDKFQHRDNTLKQFNKLYRENANDFPLGSSDEDYRRKMEKSYPIHPELFDQLYLTWGAIEKFQRTRGVLRLMAQVIHDLWMNNDPSVMIMPGSLGISSDRVEPELLKYLKQNWQSIIAGDIDGTSSVPYKIDQSAPNLNKHSATRRIARTIFMGSAPETGEQNKGLDDKQINLGVIQPGERPAIFGDALRRLTNNAKYMHNDMGRYWYSIAPSLNRMAVDRAGQIEDAVILMTIDKELATYINGIADRGDFDTVQVAPSTSADVPDEAGGVRAIILGVAYPHTKGDSSKALKQAQDILLQRGSTPRIYRNMLVFIAPESRQIESLKSAIRATLAWDDIVKGTTRLNLTQSDSALAKSKLNEAKETEKTRLKECWSCLIFPVQNTAQSDVQWMTSKVASQDGLLAKASKKLVDEGGLMLGLGARTLDRDLQKYIWNGHNHLFLKDLWEYLNRYTYLPRLKNKDVFIETVRSAISTGLPGPFAYAEQWDEVNNSYEGLVIEHGLHAPIFINEDNIIIKPDIAEQNRPAPKEDVIPASIISNPSGAVTGQPNIPDSGEKPTEQGEKNVPNPEVLPTRFTGAVEISSDRPAHEIRTIIEAIVEQLTTLPNCNVSIKLEIDAEKPDGFDRSKIRTISENANTLGFIDKEFR